MTRAFMEDPSTETNNENITKKNTVKTNRRQLRKRAKKKTKWKSSKQKIRVIKRIQALVCFELYRSMLVFAGSLAICSRQQLKQARKPRSSFTVDVNCTVGCKRLELSSLIVVVRCSIIKQSVAK